MTIYLAAATLLDMNSAASSDDHYGDLDTLRPSAPPCVREPEAEHSDGALRVETEEDAVAAYADRCNDEDRDDDADEDTQPLFVGGDDYYELDDVGTPEAWERVG